MVDAAILDLEQQQEHSVIVNSATHIGKLAELISKLADEATTFAHLADGTVIAVRMKPIVSTYKWNEQKNDFVAHRARRPNRRSKKGTENDELESGFSMDDEE